MLFCLMDLLSCCLYFQNAPGSVLRLMKIHPVAEARLRSFEEEYNEKE